MLLRQYLWFYIEIKSSFFFLFNMKYSWLNYPFKRISLYLSKRRLKVIGLSDQKDFTYLELIFVGQCGLISQFTRIFTLIILWFYNIWIFNVLCVECYDEKKGCFTLPRFLLSSYAFAIKAFLTGRGLIVIVSTARRRWEFWMSKQYRHKTFPNDQLLSLSLFTLIVRAFFHWRICVDMKYCLSYHKYLFHSKQYR